MLTCEPRVGLRGHTYLGEFDWFLVDLGQSLDCIGVVAEILLAANEQEGRVGAEVAHLGHPFLRHVLERVGAVDGEADQQNVGVGVRQGAKTVIVLLACSDNHVSMCTCVHVDKYRLQTSSIPEGKLDLSSLDLNVRHVVLEYGRDVDLSK